MPKFLSKRIVGHSAQDMFALVADVEKYPEFLPMCKELKLISHSEHEGFSLLLASMTIGYKIFCETFITSVELRHSENRINVAYADGPFKYLENRWTFYALSNESSEIEFFIDYEFKSRTLGLVMGTVFDAAFTKFTNAFEKRADELYGKGS